jgi:hypothetical protein
MTVITIKGRGIMPGVAQGPALIGETLQGNAALNFKTGEIIQVGHSLKGKSLKGSVLVLAGAAGPVAMVFPRMDSRTAGAAAAMKVPVVTDLEEDIFALAEEGDSIRVDGDRGIVEIIKPEHGY